MLFDTHAHYDDEAFDADREELLDLLPQSGIELVLNPGCDVRSSQTALELAQKYDYMYAAVGIHPEEVTAMAADDIFRIRELTVREKCAAIGEIGLDYYWDDTHKAEQKNVFIAQLELALELRKPVIIHDREAHGDTMEIIRRYPELRGVFHCYSGSAEMAEELLNRGWYLGFDGPITYKNARKAVEVLTLCPTDRMLIETDSPYLSPVPMRGKRNDSRNLRYVVQRISEIKGLSAETVTEQCTANGKRLFGIEGSSAR